MPLVPCLFGDPYPMVVFIQIIVGLSFSFLACDIDFSIALKSCPSTLSITFHPYDSNLFLIFSVNAKAVFPSIEILFIS